jgi:predicted Zn finger-like uncharacterized protein
VGGHDDGGAQPVEGSEQVQEPFRHVGIDIARRLVGDQQIRLRDNRAGDRHPLLLAAGKGGRASAGAVGKSDPGQHFAYRPLDFLLRPAGNAHRQCDIIEGGQMADQPEVLEDNANSPAKGRQGLPLEVTQFLAKQANAAACGALREVEELEKRRLTGAGRAGEEIEPALGQAEIEVAQDFGARAVPQSNAIELNDRGQRPAPSIAPLPMSHRGRRLANARAFLFTGKETCPVKGMSMILTCPACGTQYVVKDGAIPEGGRKVRCASCRHSWHQEPPPLELDDAIEPPEASGLITEADQAGPVQVSYEIEAPSSAADDSYGDQGAAQAGYDEPSTQPEPPQPFAVTDEASSSDPTLPEEQPAGPEGSSHQASDYERPTAEAGAGLPPEEVDDDFSPFAVRETVERKGRGPLVVILLIVVLVAAVAALFWFLAPPEWKSRVGLAESGQTPLQLMMTHSDRQALESGNELLAVSGRVINPTQQSQRVPPIQAELRSKAGKIVYRWTIAPPTQTLGPGASAPFNSAEVNVPSGGEELTVSLGAPGA